MVKANNIKCLFGFHTYDDQYDVHPIYDYPIEISSPELKWVRVCVCSGCRSSLRFINYTLFGYHTCDILEETDDQFAVSVFGSEYPFPLRKS